MAYIYCVLVAKLRRQHQWARNPTFSTKVLDFAQMIRIIFGDPLLSRKSAIEVLLRNCEFVDKRSRNPTQVDGAARKNKISARVYVDMDLVGKFSDTRGRWKHPIFFLKAAKDVVSEKLHSGIWKYRDERNLNEKAVADLMTGDAFELIRKVMGECGQFPRRCVPMYIPPEAVRGASQSTLTEFWDDVDCYPASWNEETFSLYTGKPISYIGKSFEERGREVSNEINYIKYKM